MVWKIAFTLVALLLCGGGVVGQETAGDEPPAVDEKKLADAEDRLLRAELLEVSVGDLERAMEVYRAIQADSGLPESLRARALLALARCQRKLGRLDEARKLLEELVAAETAEREVLRQARSFLRELQSGAAANPDFDWLAELERNPEIQARVFELVMDLADVEKVSNARRQLLALGVIAFPVLEKMLASSRDADHRKEIATLLLRQGRYEHLAVVLDPEEEPGRILTKDGTRDHSGLFAFMSTLPTLAAEERRRFLDALAAVPVDPRNAIYIHALRLWAGEVGDLEAGIRRFEAESYRGEYSLLESLISRFPETATILAGRILDPALDADTRGNYAALLERRAPERLGVEHLEATVLGHAGSPRSGPAEYYLRKLEERGAWDVIARLVDGPAREAVGRLVMRDLDDVTGAAAAGRARVFAALGDTDLLFFLAARNDEAVPVLLEQLMRGGAEQAPVTETRPRGRTVVLRSDDWKPSPTYREAMVRALAAESPLSLAIALEALAVEPAALEDATVDRILELASSGDLHVREFALDALLRNVEKLPARAADVARAFAAEVGRRLERDGFPPEYAESPLATTVEVGAITRTLPPALAARETPQPARIRSRRVLSRGNRDPDYVDTFDWVLDRAAERGLAAVYPAILDLAEKGDGVALHRWLVGRARLVAGAALPPIRVLFLERIDALENRELVESLVSGGLDDFEFGEQGREKVATLRKRVVLDRSFDLETRWRAFPQNPPPWDWFEWPAFLRSDDPMSEAIVVRLADVHPRYSAASLWRFLAERGGDIELEAYRAALESPHAAVRASAAEHRSLERGDPRAWLEKALGDPVARVRRLATERLILLNRADTVPLFIGLFDDPDFDVRHAAIGAFMVLKDPASVEPLAKLLDDPDIRIRETALHVLKQVRQALEERGEWKKLLEAIRDDKSPPQPSETKPPE